MDLGLMCCRARLAEGFWAPVSCLLWLLHLLFLIFCDLLEQRRQAVEQRRELEELRAQVGQMQQPLLQPQQV